MAGRRIISNKENEEAHAKAQAEAPKAEAGGFLARMDSRERDRHNDGRTPNPVFTVSSDTRGAMDKRYAAYDDPTDRIANAKKHYIEIYHIPTKRNLFFKSFLKSFTDTYSAVYNKENVFGRMDPIATYKRTGRVINLSWEVPSSGINDAKENMAKANELIQMLYPVYDDAGGGSTTMRSGPIFKIKMGNLIIKPGQSKVMGEASKIGLPGIIEGFTYDPALEHGVYDPGHDGEIYPKVITAKIQFTVLHDTPLGWYLDGNGNGKPRYEPGASTGRFPYGGDNSPVEISVTPTKPPHVRQADWRSFLDLQADLIKRRVTVRANKLLQPARDTKQFFNL